MPGAVYTVPGMIELFTIELEPEVANWLDSLTMNDFAKVDALAGRLAEDGTELDEPYSRHLQGKVRELRLSLARR